MCGSPLCVCREGTAGWEVHCGAADLAFACALRNARRQLAPCPPDSQSVRGQTMAAPIPHQLP